MSIITKFFHRKRLYKFEPDYIVPPSETIKEAMKSIRMSVAELHLSTSLTGWEFAKLLCDEIRIDNYIANVLSSVLGGNHKFWINLSNNYFDKKEKKMPINNELQCSECGDPIVHDADNGNMCGICASTLNQGSQELLEENIKLQKAVNKAADRLTNEGIWVDNTGISSFEKWREYLMEDK